MTASLQANSRFPICITAKQKAFISMHWRTLKLSLASCTSQSDLKQQSIETAGKHFEATSERVIPAEELSAPKTKAIRDAMDR